MAQNLCGPQSIYGSYQQTLFLGCSVLGLLLALGGMDNNRKLLLN